MGLHDKLFKQLFSEKPEVEEFITHVLPMEIIKDLDITTLKKDDAAYIDENLKENFADVVYSCTYGGKLQLKFVLLFEHKSEYIEYPQPQLNTYILRIWAASLAETNKRAFVLPIIFYHGNVKWVKKKFSDYFAGINESMKKYIPDFDYVLVDISELTDEKIEEYFKLQTLRISIFLMKYIFKVEELKQKISRILSTLPQLVETERGKDFFITLYYYLSNLLNEKDMELVKEEINVIRPQGYELLEFFRNQLGNEYFEKGIERGFEKGIEKGIKEIATKMILEGESDERIIKYTNLSVTQIKKLRNEVEKNLLN